MGFTEDISVPDDEFAKKASSSKTLASIKDEYETSGPKDCTLIPFQPPAIVTTLINNDDQRIVEVCIWLQSGMESDDNIVLRVSDDNRHLIYQVRMDNILANGWGIHKDLVPNGKDLTKEQRATNSRVHHWNTLINKMRSSQGGLPWFSAEIELPEEVCSNKILRKSGKASQFGARILVVELLLEDSKMSAGHKAKRGFDVIDTSSDDSI